ncbi:hypothetical protein LA303_07835 [Candidatus Sulfidibacterium hydrothermale]|uniref:hypothetical protein n=1 Tax=Candidatus Sulfidibacterium hydrothermale TaxID=2875962 RepID=UPI001F0A8B81|nr:hypothetical protein [Candidatus Sulfidibacterium hydrothermale]UBM61333.1 hypothetical protein LA303_07835 [Candidatus Sulfidibacterium hydrothermale]
MLKKGFLKPELSINNLGKRQFWTGIIMGVVASFVLSYFFNYSRESLRSITFMGDPLILTEKEFRLYDLFFAAFSTSLGFGFTINFWLTGRNKIIKKRYLQIFTISNAWFITFVALMIVSRFGSILPITLYTIKGYDNQLDFLHTFWLLLILIPIYVFFAQWNTIRLIFRAKNWVLLSIVFFCITTFYLFETTTADREILNKNYYSVNKEYFNYIDQKFQMAKKYGIVFPASLKQVLQKEYAERTTNLVNALKNAFNKNKIVPLDTLILEEIVIHNLKITNPYSYNQFNDIDKNWPYAFPEQVYCQIQKHDVNSIETKVLFEILHEQASLFTSSKIDWNKWKTYSPYERQKSIFKQNLLYTTKTIQSRLIQVINLLRSEKKYKEYQYLLPVMRFNDKGRQKQIKINIKNGC